MKIKYYGHSCFEIEINNKKIITDPFITNNDLAKNIDIDSIKVDYILISHGHEDHIADVHRIYNNNKNCILISNYEITTWFTNKYKIQNTHPMNIGGNWKFEFGNIKMIQAIHSSTMPDGASGGIAGGYVINFIENNINKNIYFAGDTSYYSDMKLIKDDFHKIDYALLPVGDNFTMGIDDAYKCAIDINAQVILPMHYDTFGYIKIDKELLSEKFKKLELKLINIEEEITS